jgi:MASE1
MGRLVGGGRAIDPDCRGTARTWLWPRARNPLRDRPLETVVALGSVVTVSIVLFFDLFDLRGSGQSVAFPIFPVIVWIAFRVGPRGTSLAALAFSVMAIAATEQGLGPFVGTTSEKSLLYLAVFIALVSVSGAAVAAVVAERDVDRLALAATIDRAAQDVGCRDSNERGPRGEPARRLQGKRTTQQTRPPQGR